MFGVYFWSNPLPLLNNFEVAHGPQFMITALAGFAALDTFYFVSKEAEITLFINKVADPVLDVYRLRLKEVMRRSGKHPPVHFLDVLLP